MTSKIVYQNGLRTIATHIQSGTSILTDAPTDNKGKGEAFSPTDLVATALASCMLTIMGIKADEMNISIEGATAETEKIMGSMPRRISQINIRIHTPITTDDKTKKILEKSALTCPVARSLSADLVSEIQFSWN